MGCLGVGVGVLLVSFCSLFLGLFWGSFGGVVLCLGVFWEWLFHGTGATRVLHRVAPVVGIPATGATRLIDDVAPVAGVVS